MQEGVDEYGIEAVLMGMASQVTELADQIVTPDLRGTCTALWLGKLYNSLWV